MLAHLKIWWLSKPPSNCPQIDKVKLQFFWGPIHPMINNADIGDINHDHDHGDDFDDDGYVEAC